MSDGPKTATEMMQQVADEAFKTRMSKDYNAAIADAFIYGAGWLMVDQSGKVKHVKPSEVMTWSSHAEQNKAET